jgi:hypothetical protein
MTQLTKKSTTPFLRAPKIPFSNRMFHGMFLGLTMLCLLFASANAKAACGMMGNKSFNPTKFPYRVQTDPANATIVGMWQATYTIGNTSNIFNQTLDQWHSDGTEFENADLSPLGGNICMGVWKQIGPLTVRLHHIGLMFSADGLDAVGSFTLDEVNTVALNGKTYSGTFTFITYDTYGNYSGTTITGKIAATRVTVN